MTSSSNDNSFLIYLNSNDKIEKKENKRKKIIKQSFSKITIKKVNENLNNLIQNSKLNKNLIQKIKLKEEDNKDFDDNLYNWKNLLNSKSKLILFNNEKQKNNKIKNNNNNYSIYIDKNKENSKKIISKEESFEKQIKFYDKKNINSIDNKNSNKNIKINYFDEFQKKRKKINNIYDNNQTKYYQSEFLKYLINIQKKRVKNNPIIMNIINKKINNIINKNNINNPNIKKNISLQKNFLKKNNIQKNNNYYDYSLNISQYSEDDFFIKQFHKRLIKNNIEKIYNSNNISYKNLINNNKNKRNFNYNLNNNNNKYINNEYFSQINFKDLSNNLLFENDFSLNFIKPKTSTDLRPYSYKNIQKQMRIKKNKEKSDNLFNNSTKITEISERMINKKEIKLNKLLYKPKKYKQRALSSFAKRKINLKNLKK